MNRRKEASITLLNCSGLCRGAKWLTSDRRINTAPGILRVWRKVFVINALIALYFNFFVLVAQIFQKTLALKELAPAQAEPPFAIAQGMVLVAFVGLRIAAVRNFKASPLSAATLSR